MTAKLLMIGGIFMLSACAPKSELDASQAQLSELQSQMTALQAENAQLRAQLEKKPDLPIEIALRKALTGPGYVAVLNTTTKSPVSLLATLKSNALGTSKRFEIHVNPSVPYNLVHLEGAVIEEGDIITLENQNYSPVTLTVNAN